jgi:hypothetical protein
MFRSLVRETLEEFEVKRESAKVEKHPNAAAGGSPGETFLWSCIYPLVMQS